MISSSRPLPLIGLALLTVAPVAWSAGVPAGATVDTIIVEGEPGNFTIQADEVEFTQASDLADLLSNESGVAVGGGSAVAQKVYVRGFEDTMLNVSIDGAQQPAELYHHQTRVQIEPEFIKSIELDAGAGAATAGPGALTGAMRVRTRNAFDMLQSGQALGALIKGTAGFNGENNYKGVASLYGRIGGHLGLMASYVYQDGGDYDDGSGERVSPTAYAHRRGQIRFNGKFAMHDFDLSIERLDDRGTYYERPHMTNFAGRFILSDHTMTRDTVSYNHRFDPDSAAVDLQATLFYNQSDYENHRNTTGSIYGLGEQGSAGMDLRNTSRWERVDVVYGVDYRHDSLDATQHATPPPYWGSTRQDAAVAGIYAQADWRLAPAWLVSAGLRYDHYSLDVESGVGAGANNSDSRISPNVSLEWQLTDGFRLRGAYSEAFRGITIREAFFSALYAHHGDLQGEDADNIELGFAWERGGFHLRGTVFRQEINHYINAVFVGPPSTEWGYWANTGTAEVDGYEAEMGQELGEWAWGFGVWKSDNEFDGRPLNDSDLGLGTVIGRTWTGRLDWTPNPYSHYGVRTRYVESVENAISPDAPPKAAYAVLDLLARWTVLDGSMVLGAGINNALDDFYYDQGTYSYHPGSDQYIGFPAPGREFAASLTYRF